MRNTRIKNLAATALLAALMLVLQITGIGIIPIPPAGVTVLHIPIIIGTLACGLMTGLVLGLEFGIMSLVMAYRVPTPLSICFMDPVVAIIPRLLIPLAVWLVARAMHTQKRMLCSSISALAGSLANTVFVLGTIALLYGEQLALALGTSPDALLGAVVAFGAISGLPEAAVAAILTVAVDKALRAMGYYGEGKT